jgi:hypothetical protein
VIEFDLHAVEELPPGTAINASTRDKTTCGSTNTRCHAETKKYPPEEEENTGEHQALEHNRATLLAMDSNGELATFFGG